MNFADKRALNSGTCEEELSLMHSHHFRFKLTRNEKSHHGSTRSVFHGPTQFPFVES